VAVVVVVLPQRPAGLAEPVILCLQHWLVPVAAGEQLIVLLPEVQYLLVLAGLAGQARTAVVPVVPEVMPVPVVQLEMLRQLVAGEEAVPTPVPVVILLQEEVSACLDKALAVLPESVAQ
jgi:hypothetical protein